MVRLRCKLSTAEFGVFVRWFKEGEELYGSFKFEMRR